MQAYSITINLPEELQSQLESITQKYLSILKDKNWIQSYEQCESGKKHCHIGYLSTKQKYTSNETKKFNNCYEFQKSLFPNAIIHKAHNDWATLVGYIAKASDFYETTMKNEQVTMFKRSYLDRQSQSLVKLAKTEYLTINEIAVLFIDYYKVNQGEFGHLTRKTIVSKFYRTIPGRYLFTTRQRINTDVLVDMAEDHYYPGYNEESESEIEIDVDTPDGEEISLI